MPIADRTKPVTKLECLIYEWFASNALQAFGSMVSPAWADM